MTAMKKFPVVLEHFLESKCFYKYFKDESLSCMTKFYSVLFLFPIIFDFRYRGKHRQKFNTQTPAISSKKII